MPLLPKNLFAVGALNAGTRFSRSALEIIPFPLLPVHFLNYEFTQINRENKHLKNSANL